MNTHYLITTLDHVPKLIFDILFYKNSFIFKCVKNLNNNAISYVIFRRNKI